MTLLLIILIVIVATPQEDGPKAQPMKDGLEILRDAGYLTGSDQSDEE